MAKSISINVRSTFHNFVKCTQCLFTWILFLQTGTNVDLSCITLLQVYSVYIIWSSTYNSNPHINSLDNYWPWYITETWCIVFFYGCLFGNKNKQTVVYAHNNFVKMRSMLGNLWHFRHFLLLAWDAQCWNLCGECDFTSIELPRIKLP